MIRIYNKNGSYKAVGLSLIIISTGLIIKHFFNIFSSKKVIGNVFIIIFLIAILLLGILTLTGGLEWTWRKNRVLS